MKNNLKFLLYFLPFLLFSCTEDIFLPEGAEDGSHSGIPVDITAELFDGYDTRGVADSKKKFNPGEVIHVEASFFNEKNEKIHATQYKTFQLDSDGKWQQVGATTMTWPGTSKKGVFKAYFVKKFQESLELGDSNRILYLSEIEDQTDPLYAEKTGEWGQKINLSFNHICTHLTFRNLEPDITDYFWLLNKKSDVAFHNAFRLVILPSNEIKAEFISVEDKTYKKDKVAGGANNGSNEDKVEDKFGLVYIQRPSLFEDDERTSSKVEFYLEPGDYSDIEIRTINNHSYISYKSEETKNLLGNQPYIIDILKNRGVTFLEDEENWDEDPEDAVDIIKPEEFLQSIVKGSDYELEVVENGETVTKTIIKSTAKGSLLCCNVDFKFNAEYAKDFMFEMPQGKYFDGGNHFITNIATNLFENNNGIIQHLGLKNVECEVEIYETDPNVPQFSQWGLLCRNNRGEIDNIYIDNFNIGFNITEGIKDERFTFDIGGLVGNNSGSVTNLSFGGNHSIYSSSVQNEMGCTLNIGGFIGQSNGVINNIKPVDESSQINVSHTLHGLHATIYVGGAVGQCSTDIYDVSIPRVSVDSSQSSGLVGNTGGMVGRLRGTVGTPSIMSSCTVAGVVKGLKVASDATYLTAYSYTGGLVGYISNYNITDCRALCSVELDESTSSFNSVLATGGGFGRILLAENDISSNYIWGSHLSGPSFIGNFCGIGPKNKNWDIYKAAGNVVKEILPQQFIGAGIDDNRPEDNP